MQLNVEKFYKYLDGLGRYTDLLREEDYKHDVYATAHAMLDFLSWNPSDIGTGMIARKAIKAVDVAANLVHYQQKLHFKKKIDGNVKKAEQLLYNIYRNDQDARSFDDAVAFWGGKYDLIAYLFFIKDDEKYLPISSSNFDERLALLDIPLKTARSCSSQNYFSFVQCMDTLRKYMEAYYGFKISLLDAHSVIWQLEFAKKYAAEAEEQNADADLIRALHALLAQKNYTYQGYSEKPIKRQKPLVLNGQTVYPRNRFVALNALYRANHSCELDSSHESFIRKNSNDKYMEVHHLVPMSRSEEFDVSLDREQNVICLCSNCHNEIHYGKRAKELVAAFYEQRKDQLKSVGIDISLGDLLKMYEN